MLIVGLTGNIGMGKSTVLDMFRDLGAVTLKTDGIVRVLLKKESVLRAVRRLFGKEVFQQDGTLDKLKIASIVFSDKEKRRQLEGLLHPLVFKEIQRILKELGRDARPGKVVIIEIPLLFEKDYAHEFHKVVTVFTDTETALQRLRKAGMGRKDAQLRLDAQMPVEEKVKRSDFTIDNTGDIRRTLEQVKQVYTALKGLSPASGSARQ